MAKRNKAKFPSKGRKSALRIEALEQRQLLAAVTGSGTEVGSNIIHPNGNVYDQVLMTGSSVTVGADAGQVTRVSFMDLSGDIVQAEFSGAGTMTVSLADFGAAAVPTTYNQPGVSYVKGNATFIIQGSDATSNFSTFSVGQGNAVNADLFTGGLTGGNNIANVKGLQIVSNPLNPGGFSNFGGIYAGNANFAAESGTVGIAAANVNTQGPVIIGDVDASNAAVPTLNFGSNSQFSSLTVAGGDLLQTNGAQIVGGTTRGITSVNYTTGATSLISTGSNLPAQIVPAGITWANTAPTTNTLDTASTYDLTGKSQTDINSFFSGRTFTNPLAITGDLGAGFNISAVEFRGLVTITGNVSGTISTTSTQAGKGLSGGLVVTGNLANTVTTNGLASLTVGGILSSSVTVNEVGNAGGAVGAVSLGSVAEGRIIAASLGAITVTGNVTGDGGGNAYVFRTTGSTGTNLGTITSLTVSGDVNLDAATDKLLDVSGTGTIGAVTLSGGGTLGGLGTTAALNLGMIDINGFGAGQTSVGAVSITETANANWGGLAIGTGTAVATSKMGDITITGGSATSGQSLTLSGRIGANDIGTDFVAVGNITVSGFNRVTLDATAKGALIGGSKAGDISVTVSGGNTTQASTITVTDFVSLDDGSTGTGETMGTVTFNAGAGSSTIVNNVTINAFNTFAQFDKGAMIGDVSITGRTVTLAADIQAATIGNITLTAAGGTTFSNNVGIWSTGTVGTLTVSNNLTLSGTSTDQVGAGDSNADGVIVTPFTLAEVDANIQVKDIGAISVGGALNATGTGANIAASGTVASLSVTGNASITSTGASSIQVNNIGDITIGGTTTFNNSTFPSILANDNTSAVNSIGNITLARVVGAAGTEIQGSKVGNVTITAAVTDSQTAVSAFDILAAPNGDTVTVVAANTAATNGAARLANSEQVTLDGSNLSSYKIGNISVTSTMAFAYTGTSLFSGDNSFAALGGMGTVTLSGGSAGTQQTKVFAANTDAAWFAAGDVDGFGNTTANLSGSHSLGSTTAGNTPNFTAGTVSIGNVTINALQTTTGGNRSEVDGIAGAVAASGGTIEGLAILSGVMARNAGGSGGDVITHTNGAGASTINMIAVDADLKGTIGTVQVTSNNAFGFYDIVAAGLVNAGTGVATRLAGGAADLTGGIVAATQVGTIQGNASIASTATSKIVIIGDANATTDDTVEAADAANQIVVVVL